MGHFHLHSTWMVEATVEEVADILADVERLPHWWGDVYLSADVLEPGDANGMGRIVAFHSKGRLPYTLRWKARVIESKRPHGWTIEATGDLQGQGVWRLTQEGPTARVDYDWQVVVEKPILKLLSPLLRPVFAANHRWAMARGLEGLKRELVRHRSAKT